VEAMIIQLLQYLITGAGNFSGWIYIFHTYQPFAFMLAGMDKAC
jgi:hypothetical protein